MARPMRGRNHEFDTGPSAWLPRAADAVDVPPSPGPVGPEEAHVGEGFATMHGCSQK